MRKTFLLMAAMYCLVMHSWADCICFGDSLPAQKYGDQARTIRNISYDDQDSTISFNDTYEPSFTAYERMYAVYFYEWQEGYQFYRYATGGAGAVDYFGAGCDSNTQISIVPATSSVNNCAGGPQTVDISYQVAELKKRGYTRVLVAIKPQYQISATSDPVTYSKAAHYYELLNTLVIDIVPTEYNLKVLGKKVTSNNYKDILYDGGSVVYDPTTKELTLNKANLSATYSEAITINDDVTMICKGINSVESQGNYAAIAQSLGSLKIKEGQLNVKSQNGAGIYAQSNLEIISTTLKVQSTSGSALQLSDKMLIVRYAQLTAKGNNTSVTTTGISSFTKEQCDVITTDVTFSSTQKGFVKSGSLTKGDVEIGYANYGIYVQGVQVTNTNCNDVLSNGGKVKYDDATKTLTLNNATISATSGYGIEFPWMHDFILELKGTNTINTTSTGIYTKCEKLTIQGTGKLNVVSSNNNAIDADGSAYKDKYALTIQGGCTLNLKGSNNGIITFGSLHINRSTVVMQGNDASCQCKNGLYMTDADICNAGYYFSGEKIYNKNKQVATDEVTIGDKKLGIYIKGTQVTSFIAKDILKDGGTVSYDDATKTLTLNGATIKGNCSAGLAIYQDYLKISLIGENTIYNTSTTSGDGINNDVGRTIIQGTGSNDVLKVQSDGGNGIYVNGDLNIEDCKVTAEGKKGSAVASDGRELTITRGTLMAYGNKTNATISNFVNFYTNGGIISRHTYDAVSHKFLNKDGNEATDNIRISNISSVSIKEEWITVANKDDILGDKTAKYDFSTKTLTLNNAIIQYADNDVISAWQDLTIQCVGNNTIQNTGNNYGIYQDGGSLSFTGNGNITIKAEKDAAIYSDYDVAITGGCTMTTQCADGFALSLTGEPLTIDGATLIAKGNGKDATINGCTDLILKNGATIRSAHTYDATSHKFYVKGTTNEAKDDIIIGISGGTGIDEVAGRSLHATGACKVISDGQLLILRDGKMYNAQGTAVE